MDRRQFTLGAIALMLGASPAFGKGKYDAWKGRWKGKWDGTLSSTLTVSRVSDNGNASGRYTWGRAPDGSFGAGGTSWSGKISGNTLNIRWNWGRVSYTMRGGVLHGRFTKQGTSTGVFTK